MPDVLRIERTSFVHVARPLDDGASVGKDRELVFRDVEFQHELVESHLPQRRELLGHRLEIELDRGSVRYLHRITATQAGCLRAVRAFEPLELALLAADAVVAL